MPSHTYSQKPSPGRSMHRSVPRRGRYDKRFAAVSNEMCGPSSGAASSAPKPSSSPSWLEADDGETAVTCSRPASSSPGRRAGVMGVESVAAPLPLGAAAAAVGPVGESRARSRPTVPFPFAGAVSATALLVISLGSSMRHTVCQVQRCCCLWGWVSVVGMAGEEQTHTHTHTHTRRQAARHTKMIRWTRPSNRQERSGTTTSLEIEGPPQLSPRWGSIVWD
jgi:hypothetical protein